MSHHNLDFDKLSKQNQTKFKSDDFDAFLRLKFVVKSHHLDYENSTVDSPGLDYRY